MWRIVFDSDSDVLTLRRFKNEILQHARDEEARQYLSRAVKQAGFEAQASHLESKVKHARNNYLAHLNKQHQLQPDPREIADMAMELDDLKTVLDASFKLFRTLSFEAYPSLWLWSYHEQARREQDTDIDRLLDNVAVASDIFHLPETSPEDWQEHRATLSSTELERFSMCRRRLGLSPAT